MKKIITAFLLIFAVVLSACSKAPDNAVAMVDGEPITIEEYKEMFGVFKKAYENKSGVDYFDENTEDGVKNLEVLREMTMKNLLLEHLVVKKAIESGITVTDEEVNETLAKSIESIGEDKYKEVMAQNNLTEEYLRNNVKTKLIMDRYKERFISEMQLTDEDAQKYFEENKDSLISVKVNHILTKDEESALALKERIHSISEFEELAKEESLDTATAVHGGSLGFIARGEIAEFDDYAFTLDTGVVSDPIKTELGYHLLIVTERKDSYEALRDNIIEFLKIEAYDKHVNELNDKADIQIFKDRIEK